jgi:EmrB/QacA subfamily drug resistance transporter
MVAAALATFMTALDNNVVNVAIPTIQRSLHLSQSGIEWVVSAYILFFAGLILAGGRLSDVFGHRRIFLTGLSVFTLASLMAGFAGSASVLIAARGLQGIGAAILAPTTLAIASHAYPDVKERARAVGMLGAVGALALAVGPVIGGYLSQHVSWGWIFFLNGPIGVITFGLGVVSLPAHETRSKRRLDIAGMNTSALSLFALTFGLIQGTHDGWTSPLILASFAVAIAAALSFVRVERRAPDPMIDLSLFSNSNFRTGSVISMVWAFGLFGIYFFTALYLQDVLGFSATKAGLAFVPMAIFMAAGAIISDRINARVGPHRLVGAAMLLMGMGMFSFSFFGTSATFADLMPGFAIIGIGGGFTVPLTSIIINTVPRERAGIASAIFNASREVAGLLGITVLGVILSARQNTLVRHGHAPIASFLAGYQLALLVASALVVSGGVIAFIGLRRVTPPAEVVDGEGLPASVHEMAA